MPDLTDEQLGQLEEMGRRYEQSRRLASAPSMLDVLNGPQEQPSVEPGTSGMLDALQQPAQAIAQQHLDRKADWSEAEGQLTKAGYDSEQYRQTYKLNQARQKAATMVESRTQRIISALPGASAGLSIGNDQLFNRAMNRYNRGEATDDDYDRIAQYERMRQIKQTESTGATVQRAVERVPAMVGEGIIAGKILGGASVLSPAAQAAPAAARTGLSALPGYLARSTATGAVMPSMAAEMASQRSTVDNTPIYALKNVVPAVALSGLQTAVLGSFQRMQFVKGVPTVAGRIGAQTATGLAEQQGADTLASAADNFLADNWKTNTRYGTLGSIIRGDNDAAKHALAQVATFALFSAFHPAGGKGDGKPDPAVVQDAVKSLDAAARQGKSLTSASKEVVDDVNSRIMDLTKSPEQPAPEQEAAKQPETVMAETANTSPSSETPETPRQKVDRLTNELNQHYEIRTNSQRSAAALRDAAQLPGASDVVKEQYQTAQKAFKDADKAHKSTLKKLTSARDELMRQPESPETAQESTQGTQAGESGSQPAERPVEAKYGGPEPWEMTRDEFVKKVPKADRHGDVPTVEKMTRGLANNKVPTPPGISRHKWFGTDLFVAADKSGNPIGALQHQAAFEHNGKKYPASILGVAVEAAHQRQGVGSKLFAAAKDAGIDIEAASGEGGYTEAGARFAHRRSVAAAIGRGEKVPAEVLKDYPDLHDPLKRSESIAPEETHAVVQEAARQTAAGVRHIPAEQVRADIARVEAEARAEVSGQRDAGNAPASQGEVRSLADAWSGAKSRGATRGEIAKLETQLKKAGATPVNKVGDVVKIDTDKHDLVPSGGTKARGEVVQKGWNDAAGNPLVKPKVRRHAYQDEQAGFNREKLLHDQEAARRQEEGLPPEEYTPDDANPVLYAGVPVHVTALDSLLKRGLGIKAAARKWLTSAGDLPPDAFKAAIDKDGRIAAAAQQVKNTEKDLRRAVGDYSRLSPARIKQMNDALSGDAQALSTLPPEVHAVITKMRSEIDLLSTSLVQSGAIQGHLAETVDANLGVYLNRSYRVFSDPKWAEKVDPAVRNRFISWLAAERQRQGRPASQDELETLTDRLLYEGKAAETPIAFLSRSKLGSKDLSILTKRQDVPPELRALWGEVEDPLVNYANSVGRMTHLLSNHVFLSTVRELGTGRYFFTEDQLGDFRRLHPDSEPVRIASEGSRVMEPLNGLTTTAEIKKAFEDIYSPKESSGFMRAYMTALGLTKYAKTVLSPITHVRNFVSNAGFAIANGHYRMGNAPDAIKSIVNDSPEGRARWQKYLELGIVGNGVHEGEFKQFAKDVFSERDASAGQAIGMVTDKRIASWVKSGFNLAEKAYHAEDSVWKAYAFENEVSRYSEAFPAMPKEQVEKTAAEIVRNTYPTYSMVPKSVKALRKFPLVGPFVSFPSEVVRTTYHTIKQAKAELMMPETRSIGATRMAGMAAALGGSMALAAVSRAMLGMDQDDEQALRRFLPKWSKDSPLLHLTKNADGNYRFIDLGSSDPHAYLLKPLIAALRGEDLGKAMQNMAQEIGEPFMAEELLTGKLADVARNTTDEGKPVYNPQASTLEQGKAIAKHVGEAFEPGAVQSYQRIQKAANGTPDEKTGKKYDLQDELVTNTTGQRVQQVDLKMNLRYKAKQLDEQIQNAGKIINEKVRARGMVSDADIKTAYQQHEAARQRLFEEMRQDYLAAQKLGLSEDDIVKSLKDGGLDLKVIRQIVSGQYLPHVPSKQTLRQGPPDQALHRAEVLVGAASE